MKPIIKTLIITACFFIIQGTKAQIVEIEYKRSNFADQSLQKLGLEKKVNKERAEFFGKGFLDFFSSGSLQASTQILKIHIGEPGGFKIPFYLFVGASGDSFGKQKPNENTVGSLLNPVGGILNGSIHENFTLFQSGDYTSLKLTMQASYKLISGEKESEEENLLFGSGYGNLGFQFQTGAWEEKDKSNIGIFWLQTKLTASVNRNSQLKSIFGEDFNDSTLYGYAIDLGIEIDNKVNLKAGVYQFWNDSGDSILEKPIFKFAMDVKM
jgi:hypothetical protein